MNDELQLNYQVKNHIGTLCLQRPPVNALSKALLSQIRAIAEQATAEAMDGKLRAMIIHGEGKCFCAGADLKERRGLPEDQVADAVRHINACIGAVGNIPVPVLALLHGAALGGGFELALAADIRIATPDAKVGLPETSLAIIPGAGGTQRLPKILGYSRALYWIASAKIFSGQEAFEQAAVDFLAEQDNLLDKGMEIASEITKNGPIAVRQAKAAIRASYHTPLDQGLLDEVEFYLPVIPTQDRTEALKAFQEKRSPKFEGE